MWGIIGMGANLGERGHTLEAAVRRLHANPRITVRGRSALYETPPLGPPQPKYLNGAVRVQTTLRPHELLEVTMQIEREFGRVRSTAERYTPRTLDLDVLWLGGIEIDDELLTVPHRELTHRAFALLPLLEIAPELAARFKLEATAMSVGQPLARYGRGALSG